MNNGEASTNNDFDKSKTNNKINDIFNAIFLLVRKKRQREILYLSTINKIRLNINYILCELHIIYTKFYFSLKVPLGDTKEMVEREFHDNLYKKF